MKDNQLNLESISSNNRPFIEKAIFAYSNPALEEIAKLIPKIDTGSLEADLVKLRDQIVNTISEVGLPKNAQVLRSIAYALQSNNYIEVRDKIERSIGFSNVKVAQILVPKLIEYFNVIQTINYLNTMPGSDGKPINLFKLPELQ